MNKTKQIQLFLWNLFAAFGMIFLSSSLSAAEKSLYNAHGKRDPFWRLVSPSGALLNYDSDLQLSDMALDGIISDPNGQNLAIINSVIVKTNDKIGLYVVSEVDKDKVILTKGAEIYVLKLKKEE